MDFGPSDIAAVVSTVGVLAGVVVMVRSGGKTQGRVGAALHHLCSRVGNLETSLETRRKEREAWQRSNDETHAQLIREVSEMRGKVGL